MKRTNDICTTECVHEDIVASVAASMPDETVLYDASELFKVFGDTTRIRILSALRINKLCVCDLARLLSMSKSAISHQLRVLRHNKLVKSYRQGKEVIYSLNDDHIVKILDMALEHITE